MGHPWKFSGYLVGLTTYTKSIFLIKTLPCLHKQLIIQVLLPERGGADRIKKWLY
jgi:hypothetical protein